MVACEDEASSNPDESITKNPFADHIPSFASVELEGKGYDKIK